MTTRFRFIRVLLLVLVLGGLSVVASAKSASTKPTVADTPTPSNEIRTGLKRGIRVIPVLLNRDGLPTREDLPADLYSLRRRQLF